MPICMRCRREHNDPDYGKNAAGNAKRRHVCEECVRKIRTKINGGPDKGVGEIFRKKEKR